MREKSTYLSYDVWKACWAIARAKTETRPVPVTTDEVVDALLREAIETTHPECFEHKQNVDQLEKKLIATLVAKFRSQNDVT